VAWVVGLAAVGLLVGGCGSFAPGASAPPAVGDASGVDMCTILTDAELSGLGIELDTRKPVDRLGEVGCRWVGEPFTLDLERGEDTVAEYAARKDDRAFVTFAENTVNGRAGVRFGVSKSGQDCAQLIDGGPVSLLVSVAAASSLGPPIDPCAEALRIAQLIETRLPKAGT
ncbi:MAG: DUF3558 family protein, partial [Pseudonocardiaceae bacterium]